MKYEECPGCGGCATRTAANELSCVKRCDLKQAQNELQSLANAALQSSRAHGQGGRHVAVFVFDARTAALASSADRAATKAALRELLARMG